MAKVRKHITAKGDKEQRARNRAAAGRLRDLRLKPTTIIKYCNGLLAFINWMHDQGLTLPSRTDDWDTMVADYVEFLWERWCPFPGLHEEYRPVVIELSAYVNQRWGG